MVKNLPAMQETQVPSLGEEDPLEKEMATYSSILAWKTPWTEEPGRLQLWGRKELDMTDRLHFTFTFTRKGAILISFRQENCLKGGRDSYLESLLCLLNF